MSEGPEKYNVIFRLLFWLLSLIQRRGSVPRDTRCAYDANGTLLREDFYTPDGKWFGSSEYSKGLEKRRFYRFTDDERQETRIDYDSKGYPKSSAFSINDQLICTFRFDLSSNGEPKRTLAIGPKDELYAEYPDNIVHEVDRDGRPPVKIHGSLIYKKGHWW